MQILKYFVREAALLLSFVVLGAMLLMMLWVTQNLRDDVFTEFKNDRVSVVFDAEDESQFRKFIEARDSVLSFSIQSRDSNKESIQHLYPELRSVVRELPDEYFPMSASVSVLSGSEFIELLSARFPEASAHLLHKAPTKLVSFFQVLLAVFFGLWTIALLLVLYFQVEQISLRQANRWSLLKMLGASTSKLFWPICGMQLFRISVAAILAIILSSWAISAVQSAFRWDWEGLGWFEWSSFLLTSILLTVGGMFMLIWTRYRRIQLA